MNPRPLDPDLLKPAAYPHLALEGEAWAWFVQSCADLEVPVTDAHHAVLEALYSHLVGANPG